MLINKSKNKNINKIGKKDNEIIESNKNNKFMKKNEKIIDKIKLTINLNFNKKDF